MASVPPSRPGRIEPLEPPGFDPVPIEPSPAWPPETWPPEPDFDEPSRSPDEYPLPLETPG